MIFLLLFMIYLIKGINKAMKIKELIELLQRENPEHEAVVNGYEGGYSSVTRIESIKLVKNVHTKWYYGKHDEPKVGEEPDMNGVRIF